MFSLELLAAPTGEPVTLAAVKTHLRIDHDEEDSALAAMIAAARQWAESYTGLAFMTQSWRLWLDDWPRGIPLWRNAVRGGAVSSLCAAYVALPKPPLQSVEEVRLYRDDGSHEIWDSGAYHIDGAAQPGRLILRAGQSWPTPEREALGVGIAFTAGYGDTEDVPEPLKNAVLQLAAHLYEQRGETVGGNPREAPYGAQALLNPFRVRSLQ